MGYKKNILNGLSTAHLHLSKTKSQSNIGLLYIQPGFDGGAIYYDDARLQLKEEGTSTINLSCNDHINVTVNTE